VKSGDVKSGDVKSGDVVKSLMERVQTSTGLCVTVDIQPQTCEAGRL
jgi:hypothetical protein